MRYEDVCEFLRSVEDSHPLSGHDSALTDKRWCEDVRRLWIEQTSEPFDMLDAVLEVRFAIAAAARQPHGQQQAQQQGQPQASTDQSWHWLLTATQVTQRTAEWYAETINVLTASEIADIWKGPRTRAALVMSKVLKEPKAVITQKSLACSRAQTGPMDWGVRYEPVVKEILEAETKHAIHELGRIRHRTFPRLAASPDGLFIGDGPLSGSLLEIKCPPTRPITDAIPFGYWCQMQIQMEVCDRPQCVYVEAKFSQETPHPEARQGWIAYEMNVVTGDSRYTYSLTQPPHPPQDSPWAQVESYQWSLTQLRQVVVMRDPIWFEAQKADFATFWADVEQARAGTWTPVLPPPRSKSTPTATPRCEITD